MGALASRTLPTFALHLALLLSQAGPFSARPLDVLPTQGDVRIASVLFCAQLLHRFRLPLPLAPGTCSMPTDTQASL